MTNVQGRGVQSRLGLRLPSSGATPVNPGRLPIDEVEYEIVRDNGHTYVRITGPEYLVRVHARMVERQLNKIMTRLNNLTQSHGGEDT